MITTMTIGLRVVHAVEMHAMPRQCVEAMCGDVRKAEAVCGRSVRAEAVWEDVYEAEAVRGNACEAEAVYACVRMYMYTYISWLLLSVAIAIAAWVQCAQACSLSPPSLIVHLHEATSGFTTVLLRHTHFCVKQAHV